MEIKKLKIKDVLEIQLSPIEDNRGFFMRTFDLNFFESSRINYKWVQENHSLSKKKNTIRGLHFQLPPHDETKLVRCIRGSILDIFVDIRPNSKTFGHWESVKLSAKNNKLVCIPKGFAHGFLTLEDNCEILYKVDNCYSKEYERGLIWNDKDLNINWSTNNPILSKKDKINMTFAEYVKSLEVK